VKVGILYILVKIVREYIFGGGGCKGVGGFRAFYTHQMRRRHCTGNLLDSFSSRIHEWEGMDDNTIHNGGLYMHQVHVCVSILGSWNKIACAKILCLCNMISLI